MSIRDEAPGRSASGASGPRVVCVLGMHRSGTSLVTRILNLLGVHLGSPEHIMAPQPDNPLGFWEHRLLEDLNNEILTRLGGSWDAPPAFPPGWETAADLEDVRRRAEAILEQEFAGADVWGWKDPRTCLTLPFWQHVMPPMRYVLCLRNPIDVARSLERRNRFSFSEGVDLWTAYMRSALAHTAGRERLLLSYEDVVERGPRALRRLAAHLGAPELADRPEIQEAVRRAVKAEARHHRTSTAEAAGDPALSFRAKSLYLVLLLCEDRARGETGDQSEIDRSWPDVLDRFGRSVGTSPRDQVEELGERDRTIALLRAELEAREVRFLAERARQGQELPQLRAELQQLRRTRRPRIADLTGGLASGVRRARTIWAGGARRLRGLEDVWYRTAWDCLPLRTLRPAAGDGQPEMPADPNSLTFRFTMPPRAIFQARIAVRPDTWGPDPAALELEVSVSPLSGGPTIERTWRIDPAISSRDDGWTECRLDLRRLTGQSVELTCRASAATGSPPGLARAVWGQPVILSRKPARDIGALALGYLQLHGLRGTLKRARISVASSAASRSPRSARATRARPGRRPSGAASSRERAGADKLRSFLSDPHAMLVFPPVRDPLVSIVIPTYNNAEYLLRCLESVLACTEVPFEVIVVDDCSADETAALLKRLRHVVHIRNESNLDFIRTCNNGARLARGRHLLFLNNDVTVTPGWLSFLVATMEEYPGCGAVHGKLVRTDGSLQEAGAIVWRDGSALGYGRDDDPLRPEYGYVREVDFGSAACLLVRTDLFRRLGGFDERYLPAYYEDADLCFGVRRLGHKVVFQPRVTVVHGEFGSGSFERAEALCRANQPRFAAKWADELAALQPPGEVLRGRDRRPGKRVLVLDDQVPAPHLGSGFPRTYRMLELLADLGLIVTFVPLADSTAHQPATDRLQQMGMEIFHGDTFAPRELLRERAGYYGAVVVSRPHNGAKFLPLVRQYCPDARLVYDAEAIFCLRDFRRAELEGRPLSERRRQRMLGRELEIMKHADVVLTASAVERDVILERGAHHDVVVWGHALDVRTPVTPFAARKDLLFVGGFLDGNPPNADAVRHFATALLPRIRRKLPACRFVVVGREPPDAVRALASSHVEIAGYVPDLTAHYEGCRAFVVPLRFGAGISLKLIEAMGHGIPAVVSTLGAAGLGLQDGREALIAGTDDEFVDKVVRLCEDEALWSTVQHGALDYVRRHCSADVMRGRLARALDVESRRPAPAQDGLCAGG